MKIWHTELYPGKGGKGLLKKLNQTVSCEGCRVKTADPATEETEAQELGGNHRAVSAYKEYYSNHRGTAHS